MTSGVLEVELTFPRRAEKSGPVSLVQDGDNATATAYKLVGGDTLDLDALRRWSNVVDGYVVGRKLAAKAVRT